ncbi:hypothetical protein HUW46_06404 [Amycolatopsis sp. CA-230715]|nr:hypothetical protein HUW46_06404 [Amycolatopsis sp. CA-230715]
MTYAGQRCRQHGEPVVFLGDECGQRRDGLRFEYELSQREDRVAVDAIGRERDALVDERVLQFASKVGAGQREHPRQPGERGQRGVAAEHGVPGAHDQPDRLVVEAFLGQRGGRGHRAEAADHDVEAAREEIFVQHGEPVLAHDDGQLGVVPLEARDRARHQEVRAREMRADGDRAAVGAVQLGDVPARLPQMSQHRAGVLDDGAADRRGRDPAGPAVEQARADDLFELAERPRGRGLGDAQVVRGADHAPVFGERVDEREVADLEPAVEELGWLHDRTLCRFRYGWPEIGICRAWRVRVTIGA